MSKNSKGKKGFKIPFNISKIKAFFSCIAYLGALIIFFYEIPAIRSVVKSVILWIQGLFGLQDYTAIVYEKHLWGEQIIIGVIVVCIAINFLLWLIEHFIDWSAGKRKGKNPFEKSLLRYINDDDRGRSYLITGQWGVGKTFRLNKFLKKYYGNSSRKVYRISCIGLTSREDVTSAISKAIEKEDSSLRADIVKLIGLLPVLGGIVENLLQKSYSYRSAKEGSIFVIDDFERLVSAPVRERTATLVNGKRKKNNGTKLNTNPELTNAVDIASDNISEIKEITSQNMIKADKDKYLALVGIINELVEICKNKVIIVCNTDALGPKFLSEILSGKLNCIEYVVKPEKETARDTFKDIAESFVSDSDTKKLLITDYVSNIDVDNLVRVMETCNLRLLGNVVEAFVISANLFAEVDLTDEFMDSLLSSIILVSQNYKNNEKLFRDRAIGLNLKIFYDGKKDFSITPDCRWVGYDVAAYWYMNLKTPENVSEIVNQFNNYPLVELEKELLNKNNSCLNDAAFDMVHFCYFMKHIWSPASMLGGFYCQEYLVDFLKRNKPDNGYTSEFVQKVLEDLERDWKQMPDVLHDTIFEKIYATTGVSSSGSSNLIDLYNEYTVNHVDLAGAAIKLPDDEELEGEEAEDAEDGEPA